MYRDNENAYLPRVSRCVLKQCDVDYAPEGVVSTLTPDERGENPPTLITMNLTFGETEIMTKDTVAKILMYFTRFLKVNILYTGTKEYKLVTDLWRRIKIRDKIKNEASLYSEYFVADGEKTWNYCRKTFCSPGTTLDINNNKWCNRWFTRLPLSFSTFEEFVKDKYAKVLRNTSLWKGAI